MRACKSAFMGAAGGHGVPDAGLILGRYRPLRPLGSGGSGSVWLARDEERGPRRRAEGRAPRGQGGRARRARGRGRDAPSPSALPARACTPPRRGPRLRRLRVRPRPNASRGARAPASSTTRPRSRRPRRCSTGSRTRTRRDRPPRREARQRHARGGRGRSRATARLRARPPRGGRDADRSRRRARARSPTSRPSGWRGSPPTAPPTCGPSGVVLWEASPAGIRSASTSPVETATPDRDGRAAARDASGPTFRAELCTTRRPDARARPAAPADPPSDLPRDLREPAPSRRAPPAAGSLPRTVPARARAATPCSPPSPPAGRHVLLPFFPRGWPFALAALAGARWRSDRRAPAWPFALAVPVLPLGNISLGLAVAYGVARGALVRALLRRAADGACSPSPARCSLPSGRSALLPLASRSAWATRRAGRAVAWRSDRSRSRRARRAAAPVRRRAPRRGSRRRERPGRTWPPRLYGALTAQPASSLVMPRSRLGGARCRSPAHGLWAIAVLGSRLRSPACSCRSPQRVAAPPRRTPAICRGRSGSPRPACTRRAALHRRAAACRLADESAVGQMPESRRERPTQHRAPHRVPRRGRIRPRLPVARPAGRAGAQAREGDGRTQVGLGLARLRAERVRPLPLAGRPRAVPALRGRRCVTELSDYLSEHARREGYALLSTPRVLLERRGPRGGRVRDRHPDGAAPARGAGAPRRRPHPARPRPRPTAPASRGRRDEDLQPRADTAAVSRRGGRAAWARSHAAALV